MKLLKIEKLFFFLNLAFRYVAVGDTYIFMLCRVFFFPFLKQMCWKKTTAHSFASAEVSQNFWIWSLKTVGAE